MVLTTVSNDLQKLRIFFCNLATKYLLQIPMNVKIIYVQDILCLLRQSHWNLRDNIALITNYGPVLAKKVPK